MRIQLLGLKLQVMEISLKTVEDQPVIIINNYFDNNEYNQLTNFIFDLNPYEWHTNPKKTFGAAKEEGTIQLKKNYAINLDSLYTAEGRKYCPVFNINRKLFIKEVTKKLIKLNSLFNYLESCNSDTTFLNYYENNNLYDFHKDIAVFTANYIFFKEPKNFKGGEFNIENKLINKPENNTMIIFPSFLHHKVETVLMPESKRGQCLGRFSMTQFCSFK